MASRVRTAGGTSTTCGSVGSVVEVSGSIEGILDRYTLDDETKAHMVAALVEREDGIADILRLAGAQFGMYPQIVAEVLAEAGLGSPLAEPERAMVRRQFIELMEQLRVQFEQGNDDNNDNN